MSFTPNSATATNHLTLKRARSVHDARPIPNIPKLRGDVILQVFTHRSLRGYDERLPELGSTVLDAIVTHVLFSKVPPLRVSEIQSHREAILCADNTNDWVEAYGLREKLRWDRNAQISVESPEEGRLLFCSYVAGVFLERGFETVQSWIAMLVQSQETEPLVASGSQLPSNDDVPDVPPLKRPKTEDLEPVFGHQTPPHQARVASVSPGPQPNPLAPAQPDLPFLPLFNQTVQQRGVSVEYSADFSGPSHSGTWTVHCIVNGIRMGQGVSGSKQRAKERAARQAYHAMGWAPHFDRDSSLLFRWLK